MKGRARTDLRRLLRSAEKWIEIDTEALERSHFDPNTQRVEDAEMRREVIARTRWLSQVKAALQ